MTDGSPDAAGSVHVDHVLFAVDDFAAAAERLADAHGLVAVVGGEHVGLGTANWIVPLGSSYLELAGVIDEATAATNAFGRAVLRALADGGGPFAWCVVPDDFEATAGRLGLPVNSGTRARPNGSVLSWRAAGFEASLSDPSRPFFLDWQVPQGSTRVPRWSPIGRPRRGSHGSRSPATSGRYATGWAIPRSPCGSHRARRASLARASPPTTA